MTRKQAQQIAADYKKYLTPEGKPKETMPEDLKELGPEAIVELQTPEHTENSLHENSTTGEHSVSDGAPSALDAILSTMSVPLMLIPKRAHLLHEDKEFNRIQDRLKKEYLQKKWLEDRGRRKKHFDLDNEEDLNFLYGSVDDPSTSVASQAEKVMREQAQNDPKKQKKLDRYDKNEAKVHKNMGDDPSIARVNGKIAEHAQARKAALIKKYRKEGKKILHGRDATAFKQDYESVIKRIQESTWKEYVSKNPEKAAAYIAQDEEKKKKNPKYEAHADSDIAHIKRAYDTYQKEASQGQTRPNSTNFSQPFSGPRYGKQPDITVEQATRRIEQASLKRPSTEPPVLTQQAPPTTASEAADRLAALQESSKGAIPSSPHISPTAAADRLQNLQQATPPQSGLILPASKTPPPSPVQQPTVQPSAPRPPVSQGQTRPGAYVAPRHPPPPSINRTPTTAPRRRFFGRAQTFISNIQHPQAAAKNYVRNKAGQLGSRAARKIGSTLGKQAGRFLARAGAQAATRVAVFAASNPVVLIVIGVILLIILIVVFLVLLSSDISTSNTTGSTTIPGLTLVLEDPVSHQVQNGENITYTITATYTGTAEVTLSDSLPPNTTFVSATGSFTNTNNTISWRLNNPDLAGNTASTSATTGNQSYRFTITLHPEQPDIIIKNKIVATALGGSDGGEAPNASNCNGKYALTSPFNNFGDPSCNFNKDQAYMMIKQLDPANADRWFFKIMPCESNYNPNAYLRASTSGLGAFGLFQMNPKGQGNGQYDAGNVDWHVQIPNAISYNKLIGNSFGYWQCR